ncbi:MAG: MarR family transcriptional regulator [Candidatus Altiarchaeota archaeon]
MPARTVSLKFAGAAVILMAVLMGVVLLSYMDTIGNVTQDSCTCGDTCNMVEYNTPWVVYAGFAGVLLLFLLGASLSFKSGTLYGQVTGNDAWVERMKKLSGDDKATYKFIVDSGGTVFQSEIVEKTGYSKVRVTRILDKLESRGVLERRRRGLTNIVVLK